MPGKQDSMSSRSEDALPYWDFVAGKKSFTTPIPLEFLKANVAASATILDVGCGYGRVLKVLSENGFSHLLGCDFSPNMIEIARRALPEVTRLWVSTSAKLDLPDDSVDVVLLLAVLTCIVDPAVEKATLAEIHRVLKPGGTLIINDFLFLDDRASYSFREDEFGEYGIFVVDGSVQVKHMSESRFRSLLGAFKMRHFCKQPFVTMNGTQANGATVIAVK